MSLLIFSLLRSRQGIVIVDLLSTTLTTGDVIVDLLSTTLTTGDVIHC